jgi:hypothetical protein
VIFDLLLVRDGNGCVDKTHVQFSDFMLQSLLCTI